jgi:hypothetical protein
VSELSVPSNLAVDPNAIEVLRTWLVNGELECTLNVGVFEDAETWGEVLADLARNVAEGLRDLGGAQGKDPKETLGRILNVFNDELSSPPA